MTCRLGIVKVTVRLYAELNDFVPESRRHVAFVVSCDARVAAKDLIERIGVPHTEIDLLLVNSEPAPFDRRLADSDRLAVYPVFESFDIGPVTRVRPEPLRDPRFVLDVHLGRLAAYLRLAGFDCLYRNDLQDDEAARLSAEGRRVLLTRDQGLLKRRAVTHGYYVRDTRPARQLADVVARFDLQRLAKPFTRCSRCNAQLVDAAATDVGRVPERSRRVFHEFAACPACGRVYWKGSHHVRLQQVLTAALRPGR
jgi:hypothetical protein